MRKIFMLSLVFIGLQSFAADGAAFFAKNCAVCHGKGAERHALGKSDIIKGWDSAKIYDALQGYKAGTRNTKGSGKLKNMKISKLADDDLKAVAEYVSTL